MPVTITAMSYQGAPSSLNLTLKKQTAVDSFTLYAPTYNIASGEYKQIPFAAYDQNGNQMTKYSDIVGDPSHPNITLSGFGSDGGFKENPDGTASLWIRATTVTGNQSVPQIVTAVTSTGKLSNLTLNIQAAAAANTLNLDGTKLITAMEGPVSGIIPQGAIQRVDFGYNYSGLSVTDQYGRTMDMIGGTDNAQYYKVNAGVSGTGVDNLPVLTVSGVDGSRNVTATAAAYGSNGIQIQANDVGTGTVTFTLVDTRTNAVVDTKSVTISVLKPTDIAGYKIDSVAKPIYADASGSVVTYAQTAFDANPYVYGTTAAGSKVVLAGDVVQSACVDSGDFRIDKNEDSQLNGVGVGNVTRLKDGYDSVYVAANSLDSSKSGSSCNLTVTLQGADGLLHTVTTPITSSATNPAATDLYVYADTSVSGISQSDDGTILTNTMQNGDYVTITGVTASGLIKTVKVVYGVNPSH